MRILFLTSNRLGDAVLSTGVLNHFLKDNPQAEVTVICGPVAAPIFRAVPGLARIHSVEKEPLATHWLRPFLAEFSFGWDVFIDMRNVAIMKFMPARQRLFARRGDHTRHKLYEFADLLGAGEAAPEPVIWLDDKANADAAAILHDGEGPILGLGPITGPAHKRWRPERYAKVVDELTGRDGPLPGARIAVFGAPAERNPAQPLFELLPADRTIDIMGKTDPLAAAAALARCDLYLGADSGLMHVAATLGTPTLGLFGERGQPAAYRPWGRFTAHIHKRNETWSQSDQPTAMDNITTFEVTRAAEELLLRAKSAQAKA